MASPQTWISKLVSENYLYAVYSNYLDIMTSTSERDSKDGEVIRAAAESFKKLFDG